MVQEWRHGEIKKQCTIWKVMPFLLLALTFVWVVSHYLYFSIDPVSQFRELSSTWLRALMASIIGLSTGLALRNHPNRLNLLWVGIFIAFLVLFYQYIPRAIAQNKLLVPDYDYYLFHMKINTVLIGMVLIAGTYGALIDYFYANWFRVSYYLRFWYLLYWFLSVSLSLWAFTYIVNARNGIALAMILYSIGFIFLLFFCFKRIQNRNPNSNNAIVFLMNGIGLCIIILFTYMQLSVNKGWDTLFQDVKIGVQIDRYPHWQNLAQMGYPNRDDGQLVTINTYERVAWAIAGSRAIIAYPQGVGVLDYPFSKHPNRPLNMGAGANNKGIATHSAWVELGLAFGLPILMLIFSSLLLIFAQIVRHAYPSQMTVFSLIVVIASLYTVGEVGTQHGIEILFYLLALIPALLLRKPIQIGENE
jgi:hypothetical protein